MFVTIPEFEASALSAVAGKGQKHWRALAGSFTFEPWFMFVFEAPLLDARIHQTMLVAFAGDLVDIIDRVPSENQRCVYRVEPGPRGQLDLQRIQVVWAPDDDDLRDGIAAVFELASSGTPVDSSLREVHPRSRRRVFDARGAKQAAQKPAAKPADISSSPDAS